MAIDLDPENTGAVQAVGETCGLATVTCSGSMYDPFLEHSGLNNFDITQDMGTQFPAPYANGFLNRESVQKKLGVDIAAGKGVNYTNLNQDTLICETSPPPPPLGNACRYDGGLTVVHSVRRVGRLPPQGLPPAAR